MLKFKMDKERKKYVLIAGAVVLLFGVLYRSYPYFNEMKVSGEDIALKERKLAKFHQMVQERKELEAELISLNRALSRAESGLLSGETASLGAVDIQKILNEIARRGQVEIKTMRVLKAEGLDKGRYLRVPVQFTIISTIKQLQTILYGIENSRKYLKVKEIRVSVTRPEGSEDVRSILTVTGFMKNEEISTSDPKGLPFPHDGKGIPLEPDSGSPRSSTNRSLPAAGASESLPSPNWGTVRSTVTIAGLMKKAGNYELRP